MRIAALKAFFGSEQLIQEEPVLKIRVRKYPSHEWASCGRETDLSKLVVQTNPLVSPKLSAIYTQHN